MHMNSSYIPFVTHRVWCRPAVYGYNSFDSFRKAFPELKFMGVFILTEVHWWSQTLMLDEKAWLTVCSNLCQRCSVGFVICHSVIRVFVDIGLCTGAQSCWKKKGSSPNCSLKVLGHEISRNVLLCWSTESTMQSLPFTGTKGLSPLAKQPHTIIPATTNFLQRSQTSCSPRLIHQIATLFFLSFSTENTCPLLYSPLVACFTPLHPKLCIVLCDVRLWRSCSAM